MNTIEIQVTATDKAALDKIAAAAKRQGKAIGDGLSQGYAQADKAAAKTETKTRENANKMGTAFKGAVSQMTRELDKLERSAAMSGDGISQEYASSLALVRGDLKRIVETAARTGQGLESELGGALKSVGQSIKELTPAAKSIDKSFETAARSISRDLYRIEQDAWQAGKGMDKAFQSSMLEMRQNLQRIRQEAARTGAALDSDLGNALKKVRSQANDMGEELRKGLDDGLTGIDAIDGVLGKLGSAKAGFLAGGAILGGALWDGLKTEWAEDKIGGLLAAQNGLARTEAEHMGNMAGDVFAKGFGDSAEQVGEAMSNMFSSNLISTSAPQAAIEGLTEKILVLGKTTGEESDRISVAVEKMLVTGIAKNAGQAMDIIQRSAELGLNRFGDLMDTIQEYSTSFREVGINGQEAMGLIAQATDAGARNTDIAADAIKEFGIRAQDMSVTTARGFQTLGLNAEQMGQAVAKGGKPAHDALALVLNKLKEMPPSIERNQAAVDLFGTKAEDLGQALFNMDLDGASNRFGKFAGSVVEAAQKLQDSMSGMDKFNQGVDNVKANLGEFLDKIGSSEGLDRLNAIGEAFQTALDKFQNYGDTSGLEALKKEFPEAADAIQQYIDANKDKVAQDGREVESTNSVIDTMDKLISKRQDAANGVIGLADANVNWYESLDAATAAIDKNGATLDATTQKGRDNTQALYGLAEQALNVASAMSAQGQSVDEVNGFLATAQDAFINTATRMGMPIEQAKELAKRLGLIPTHVGTDVSTNTAAALANIAAYQRALDKIPRVITTSTYVRGANINGSGGHQFLATGGISTSVWGAETGGQRHASTMVDEAGPELIGLPDGSKVMTAGATRAMAEAGLINVGGGGEGTGGGGPQVIQLVLDGRTLASVLVDPLRDEIVRRGGVVQSVLGKGA